MFAPTLHLVLSIITFLISPFTASSPTTTSASVSGYPTHTVGEPPFGDHNHVEFNLTAYLAQSHADVAEIDKRGQPGMYYCRYPNWGWPCWWQPAVWQCVNTPLSADWSIGPDIGVFCNGYNDYNCPSDGRRMEALHHPGNSDVRGLRSYRCSTQEFWW